MKTSKRVLLVSTYPIADAHSGGQLRVKAIADAYREAFTDVQHVAVFARGHYHAGEVAKTDIQIQGAAGEAILRDGMMADVLAGDAIANDPATRAAMTSLLLDYRPDVLEVEHVFPYMGLREILDDLPFKPRLVYSSHNVEYALKRAIMRSLKRPESEIETTVQAVREAESELCRAAALTTTVSSSDTDLLRALGADNLVFAPNGVTPGTVDRENLLLWEHELRHRGIESYALFVGSAHPPNLTGFRAMVTTALGYVPSTSAVVIAGGVGELLQRELDPRSIADLTVSRRLVVAGRVSNARLQSLLTEASVVLLPITEGGGSNLKTAEAVISGRPIVATSTAFRAFEHLTSLPTVTVADDPAEFRRAIVERLRGDEIPLTAEQTEASRSVLWESCLADLLEAVKAL